MKKNTGCFIITCLLLSFCSHLRAQIGFDVFSYTEFFHAPNKSFSKEQSFYSGVNEFNFSSNIGAAVSYDLNHKLNITLGVQKNNRKFDCDCVGASTGNATSQFNYYLLFPATCTYKSKVDYNELQLPLSVGYKLHTSNHLQHFIGIGNTTFYNIYTKRTVYNGLSYIDYKSNSYPIFRFAPELYYQLDYNFYKKVSLNTIIGVRKESFVQPNYAIFGKVGLGYQFGNTHTTKRSKKK